MSLNRRRFFQEAGQSKWQRPARVSEKKLMKKDEFLSLMAKFESILKERTIVQPCPPNHIPTSVVFFVRASCLISAFTRRCAGINVPLLFNISGPFGAPSIA